MRPRAVAEKQLCQKIEIVLPNRPLMGAGVHVPDVRNLLLLEGGVKGFAAFEEPIFVTAGKPQKAQVRPQRVGVAEQHPGSIARRSGKRANPRELIGMRQPNAERLAGAHRQTGQRTMRGIGLHRIMRLDVGNNVLEQVVREDTGSRLAIGRAGEAVGHDHQHR